MGFDEVSHEEFNPDGGQVIIKKLNCSLVGESQEIKIFQDSLVVRLYKSLSSLELFRCRFGLNEAYREHFDDGYLKVSGVDKSGQMRILELSDHPFFMATLFLLELSSKSDLPHPVVKGFLEAASRQIGLD